MTEPEKWFHVYRKGNKICATQSTPNMPKDHPELNNVICIVTKGATPEEAISRATYLDNTDSPKVLGCPTPPSETVDFDCIVLIGPGY